MGLIQESEGVKPSPGCSTDQQIKAAVVAVVHLSGELQFKKYKAR